MQQGWMNEKLRVFRSYGRAAPFDLLCHWTVSVGYFYFVRREEKWSTGEYETNTWILTKAQWVNTTTSLPPQTITRKECVHPWRERTMNRSIPASLVVRLIQAREQYLIPSSIECVMEIETKWNRHCYNMYVQEWQIDKSSFIRKDVWSRCWCNKILS